MSLQDEPEFFTVEATALIPDSRKFALVVGVNDSSVSPLGALKYAEEDAHEIYHILRQEACKFTFPNSILTGDKAKSGDVRSALIRLTNEKRDQDFLLFYFIGHAQPVRTKKGQNDIYFVTHDFNQNDLKVDPHAHLSMSWLRETLYEIDGIGKILIILDCCYAGNIIETRSHPAHIDIHVDVRKLVEECLTNREIKYQDGRLRIILTATRYNKPAQEREAHTLLSHLMLPALHGKIPEALDHDGNLNIHSLYIYLQNQMPEEQLPNLSGDFPRSCIIARYPQQSRRIQDNKLQEELSLLREELKTITDPDYFRKHAAPKLAQPFDSIFCKEASFTHLDAERVTNFVAKERVQVQKNFLPGLSDQEQLVRLGFLREAHPTYGALLCLGSQPTDWLSGAFLHCIHWHGNDRHNGFKEEREYRGSLLEQFEAGRSFLTERLRSGRMIDKDGSVEQLDIPIRVLEEALANALIHREYVYSDNFKHRTESVQVHVFEDRIEIASPGAPPYPMRVELFGIEDEPHLRNPETARIFYLNNYVEKAGSGISRMQKFMQDAGLSPPQFELSGSETLKVILLRPSVHSELPGESQMDHQALMHLPSRASLAVTGPSSLVVEILHNRGDDNHPDWSVGSGFFVGANLVLTASHNVDGPGELLVRLQGIDEHPALVRLQGDKDIVDLAILEVSDVAIDAPPLRYGKVDRSGPAVVERCWAVGFPRFKERSSERERMRLSVQINGVIPTLENIGYHLLNLQIRTAPHGAPWRTSEWEGMGGAVVFAEDGVVVGVISEHYRPEGESSLSVVPVTAIDDLIDKDSWWQMLGISHSRLIILPSPEIELQNEGLHVWTEADRLRYHNLREQFVNLSQVFDDWLASEPKKRGQRIRVLWLQSEEGERRHQALMACLSGVARDYLSVYDAGTDLGLLARALKKLLFSESYLIPPLISIELSADEKGSTWTDVRNSLASAENQFSDDHQPYPRLIVAGTREQGQQAEQVLQDRLEIKLIDTDGRDSPRIYSFSLESRTLKKENVYNRGLPITTKKLFGRKEELKTLTRAWNSKRCRIVSIVAYGGTGKSALVNTWLTQMREQDYLKAEKVFAWSFYSQGTKENLVSADVFVNQALIWLAPKDPIPLNPWAQGLALARLIKQHRFLLVLDGLEPLQYPGSAPDVAGQLTDDSIRALLKALSDPDDWEGLCVITTRVPLTDLHRYEGGSQKEMGRVVQIELENLSIGEGSDLLKSLLKADARRRELEKAVEEVQGHALAITLLGNYLRKVHHGDLVGRFDLEKLTVSEQEGGHARRVMAAYERWLEAKQGFAELALLHVIGLFDRPADPEAMDALLTGVDLNPYTAALDRVGGDVWNRSIEALRQMGLLNKENPEWPGTIDAHPLVREHFRDELQQGDRRMWVEGNRRLYAYYRDTAPQQPTDSKGMNHLYAAVTHGCAVGLHQQVFDEVLLPRVWRDRRTNFSSRRLGMVGSDLVALSNYFQHRQWTELQNRPISEPTRILILINAGVRLRQLGRLVDARQCFGAVVREIESIPAQAQELEDASYATAQSCELLVIAGKLVGTDGDLDTALVNGQRAIEFADRGADPYFSMHARSSLAEVYFMLGDFEKANALFEEAKAINQERHPKPRFLYSQSLFWYGYYLIETGRAHELLDDARKSEDWGRNGEDSSLLSRAIRSLMLGAVQRAIIESGEHMPTLIRETEQILDEAIVEFRTAGYADYTVRGLLERAHFYRVRRFSEDYGNTLEDLDEATFEAQRGQMELLYADILLQRLACYLDFWPIMSSANRARIRDEVAKTLTEVTALIKKLDYHRRDAMLITLQTVAVQQGVTKAPLRSSHPGSHK